eukprot:1184765-Prorocentrum_minimum.AAC.2
MGEKLNFPVASSLHQGLMISVSSPSVTLRSCVDGTTQYHSHKGEWWIGGVALGSTGTSRVNGSRRFRCPPSNKRSPF